MKILRLSLFLSAVSAGVWCAGAAKAQPGDAPEGTCICSLETQYDGTTHKSTYRWSLQYVVINDSARLITLEATKEYAFADSSTANEACRKVAAQYSICK